MSWLRSHQSAGEISLYGGVPFPPIKSLDLLRTEKEAGTLNNKPPPLPINQSMRWWSSHGADMRKVDTTQYIKSLSALYDRVSIIFLPISGIALMLVFAPIGGFLYDMQYFYLPWMVAVQHGGISSISGGFSDYSPPFIYMMYIMSGLVPFVGKVAAIKL